MLAFIFAIVAAFTPVAPQDAADATYQAVVYDGNPLAGGEKVWTGTAWKLSDTVAITAGHVCFNDTGAPITLRLVSANGQSWPATITKVAYNPFSDPGHGADLCKLTIKDLPGAPLRLAHALPAYNGAVFAVGAARGVWGPEKPLFHGWYGGGNYVTIGGSSGISGGALLTEDGVIGVLVAGIPGTPMMWFVPLDTLRAFLAE